LTSLKPEDTRKKTVSIYDFTNAALASTQLRSTPFGESSVYFYTHQHNRTRGMTATSETLCNHVNTGLELAVK